MPETEKNHLRVAILGAPCSGKTALQDALVHMAYSYPDLSNPRYYYLKSETTLGFKHDVYWHDVDDAVARESDGVVDEVAQKNPYYFPILPRQEAWRLYQNMALEMQEVHSGKRAPDPTRTFDPINLNVVLIRDDYYAVPYTLTQLIQDAGLRGLSQTYPDQDSLRTAMQQDMLRIQLWHELTPAHDWMERSIAVVDGGLPYILSYWPQMEFSDYIPVFQEFGLEWESMEDVLNFYDAIILLETLAVLTPGEYESDFFRRGRLDSPDDAVKLHHKLENLVSSHSQVLSIPAYLDDVTKFDIIFEYLKNLQSREAA